MNAFATNPEEVTLVIPLVPPSVNHYWKRKRGGGYYVSADVVAFKEAVALFARGRSVRAEEYAVEIFVYLGHGQRGDWANFEKAIGDGLQKAGVIHSDAAIKDGCIHVRRDHANPRTEITVRGIA